MSTGVKVEIFEISLVASYPFAFAMRLYTLSLTQQRLHLGMNEGVEFTSMMQIHS